jgi:hypothetical protein
MDWTQLAALAWDLSKGYRGHNSWGWNYLKAPLDLSKMVAWGCSEVISRSTST